ncbi:MAG: DoxX-like family protein [Bacteroidia bacterium]
MTQRSIRYLILRLCIALVWLINGLFCKALNLVPRHQLIVARILGSEHALWYTRLIGLSEIAMFCWILSGYRSKFCTWMQIGVVVIMNTIEFIRAPDLLLFGKWNAAVALFFILVVFLNEFIPFKKTSD